MRARTPVLLSDGKDAEIIEAIGIEIEEEAPDFAETLHERFDLAFPSTIEMSIFARQTSPKISAKGKFAPAVTASK